MRSNFMNRFSSFAVTPCHAALFTPFQNPPIILPSMGMTASWPRIMLDASSAVRFLPPEWAHGQVTFPSGPEHRMIFPASFFHQSIGVGALTHNFRGILYRMPSDLLYAWHSVLI